MDRAGRLVIPKTMRDQLGLVAGEIEVTVDGASLRVAPPVADHLVERSGRLVIPASDVGQDGAGLDDEAVRALRDADQR